MKIVVIGGTGLIGSKTGPSQTKRRMEMFFLLTILILRAYLPY